MENRKLSVGAIENDVVIDHIPVELGLTILCQFKLLYHGSAVTVGFSLPSKTQGNRNVIKISGTMFDDAAADRLTLFASKAIVNTIADFKVVDKRHPALPDEIAEVFRCPSANYISHGEPVKSCSYVRTQNGQTRLKCHCYGKTHSRDPVAEV